MPEPACAVNGRASRTWRIASGAAALAVAAAGASTLATDPFVGALALVAALVLGVGALRGRCATAEVLDLCGRRVAADEPEAQLEPEPLAPERHHPAAPSRPTAAAGRETGARP